MATQRPAFAKRDREMKLKDKARAKAERREARRAAPKSGKGPPIEGDVGDAPAVDAATDEASAGDDAAAAAPAPTGTAAQSGTGSQRPR